MATQTEAFARTLIDAQLKDPHCWDLQREAHPRPVRTFFSPADLERRAALLQMRVDQLTVAIDSRIAGRDYQQDCNETICREIGLERRKMLVEMVTGKTRTAAA